jgi:hypothetical protein
MQVGKIEEVSRSDQTYQYISIECFCTEKYEKRTYLTNSVSLWIAIDMSAISMKTWASDRCIRTEIMKKNGKERGSLKERDRKSYTGEKNKEWK